MKTWVHNELGFGEWIYRAPETDLGMALWSGGDEEWICTRGGTLDDKGVIGSYKELEDAKKAVEKEFAKWG